MIKLTVSSGLWHTRSRFIRAVFLNNEPGTRVNTHTQGNDTLSHSCASMSLEVLTISAAHSFPDRSFSKSSQTMGFTFYIIRRIFFVPPTCVYLMWREIDIWQGTSSQVQILVPNKLMFLTRKLNFFQCKYSNELYILSLELHTGLLSLSFSCFLLVQHFVAGSLSGSESQAWFLRLLLLPHQIMLRFLQELPCCVQWFVHSGVAYVIHAYRWMFFGWSGSTHNSCSLTQILHHLRRLCELVPKNLCGMQSAYFLRATAPHIYLICWFASPAVLLRMHVSTRVIVSNVTKWLHFRASPVVIYR